MTCPARNYHHGNLRDALIIAVAELIEEKGSLEFSITDAARRAGVSNAAPYRHFSDKEDLLRNVRELAFLGLANHLRTALESADFDVGSDDSIITIGLAYLDYARCKRAFFSLMWENRGGDEEQPPDLECKISGFSILVDEVMALCRRRGHPVGPDQAVSSHGSALSVATQLWALAHGIATLEANHMLDLFDRAATPEKLLTDSSRALLAGLHAPRSRSPAPAPDPQVNLPF